MGLSAGVACVVVHQIHSSVHHVTHDAICAAGASAARARRARTHPTKTTLVSPPHTRTDAHVSPQPYTTYCVYRPVRPTCPSARQQRAQQCAFTWSFDHVVAPGSRGMSKRSSRRVEVPAASSRAAPGSASGESRYPRRSQIHAGAINRHGGEAPMAWMW